MPRGEGVGDKDRAGHHGLLVLREDRCPAAKGLETKVGVPSGLTLPVSEDRCPAAKGLETSLMV